MTTTETISVAELEEMLSDDVPCGGNIFPEARLCPHDAPAMFISTHNCPKGRTPADFKCMDCYTIWAAAAHRYAMATCAHCGQILLTLYLYRYL